MKDRMDLGIQGEFLPERGHFSEQAQIFSSASFPFYLKQWLPTRDDMAPQSVSRDILGCPHWGKVATGICHGWRP